MNDSWLNERQSEQCFSLICATRATLTMSASKSAQKKRKIEDECRTFNTEWTYKYFFTNFGSKAICLLCQEIVAVFKEYNLKRHFQTKHGNFGSKLSESKLQQKVNDMVKSSSNKRFL